MVKYLTKKKKGFKKAFVTQYLNSKLHCIGKKKKIMFYLCMKVIRANLNNRFTVPVSENDLDI